MPKMSGNKVMTSILSNHIINYDIRYRMGREASEEEE